ncbi:MAG: RNA polymerase sigma factor [Spirochaetales bacterium]|nr:RNA polymerase sigma factor [Spirochaetales bacterium]
MGKNQTKPGNFEYVYDITYPLLYRIAFRITGDENISEDLCQEAFIRYYKRVIPLPDQDQARYWLIRVVKNLAFNHEKRRGRELKANYKYSKEFNSPTRSGETELLRNESARIVQRALKKLPFNLRTAIVLREYGDLSYRDIAKVLGISESNVKVRVFRAREQLKKHLDEEEVDVS